MKNYSSLNVYLYIDRDRENNNNENSNYQCGELCGVITVPRPPPTTAYAHPAPCQTKPHGTGITVNAKLAYLPTSLHVNDISI